MDQKSTCLYKADDNPERLEREAVIGMIAGKACDNRELRNETLQPENISAIKLNE